MTATQTALRDPREFRRQLLVDTDKGPMPFASVMDDWQRHDFEALDDGWRKVAGIMPVGGSQYSRAYLERGRGHSKTTDIAVSTNWVLLAAKRKLSGIVAAADKEQAGLIRDAIDKIARLNPWLADLIDVQREKIVNTHTGSELVILSSDVASSYGQTPDFIVCDELTHWPDRELWDSLLSSAAKREHCMLLVISNAGTISSWQWIIREAVRTDNDWYFSRLNGPVASWISPLRLHEQRRLLPSKAYRRLWQNEWVASSGDAIDENDLEEAIVFPDAMEGADDQNGPYVASLDLGVRSDHSALVVFALNLRGPRVRVAQVKSWNPADYGGRVPLQLVHNACVDIADKFRPLLGIAFDPCQGEYLAERLSDSIPMFRYPWTIKSKEQMALALVQAFRDREVDLYDHPGLIRDLRKISINEKAGKWTIILPHTEDGHCDIGAAFCQGLVWALSTSRDYLGKTDYETDNVFSLQPSI